MRALLSVATRDGISAFARGLQSLDVELFATDGTREHLAQDGIEVKAVSELTGVPQMLDGSVKTFHHAIYAACGNPLVERSAQLHWVHLRRVMGAVLQQTRQREQIWDEHAAIAAAIGTGDAARAVELIEHHGRNASENLLACLSDVLKPPIQEQR